MRLIGKRNCASSRELTILWTSSSSDPSSITLKISSSDPNSLSTDLTLGSNIPVSSGRYTVTANEIQNFGTGYQIQALNAANNDVVATVGGLVLGAGQGSVSTASNGQLSFVGSGTSAAGSATATATAQSGNER